jgi:hypothetical protein
MVKEGTMFSLTANYDENKEYKYVVIERLDNIACGRGGWLCVELDALSENPDSISPFDCWRVTDKYLETQIERGVIKIIESL